MLSPHYHALDTVPPTPMMVPSYPGSVEEEDVFWALFDSASGSGIGVAPSEYYIKHEDDGTVRRVSAVSAAEVSSSECVNDGASASSSRPSTIETFLATYATSAPTAVPGAPATPGFTPAPMPLAAPFVPFTPAATASTTGGHTILSQSPQSPETAAASGSQRDLATTNGMEPPPRRDLKRQRNTEASARFRQRKKQRESELECHAKHLEDEVVALRAEKSALERQVKVLLEVLGNVGRERREGSSGEGSPS